MSCKLTSGMRFYYQISGITGCINSESTSGRTICKLSLTNRGSLGVLDNPNKKKKKCLIRQEEFPMLAMS